MHGYSCGTLVGTFVPYLVCGWYGANICDAVSVCRLTLLILSVALAATDERDPSGALSYGFPPAEYYASRCSDVPLVKSHFQRVAFLLEGYFSGGRQ